MNNKDFKKKLSEIKNQFQVSNLSQLIRYCYELDSSLFEKVLSSISSGLPLDDINFDKQHYKNCNNWEDTWRLWSMDQCLHYNSANNRISKDDSKKLEKIFRQIKSGYKFSEKDIRFVENGQTRTNETRYEPVGELYTLFKFLQHKSHHNNQFTTLIRPNNSFNFPLHETINLIISSNSLNDFKKTNPKFEIKNSNFIYLYALIKNIQNSEKFPVFFKQFKECLYYFFAVNKSDYSQLLKIYQSFEIPTELNQIPKGVLFHAIIDFLKIKYLDASQEIVYEYANYLKIEYSKSDVLDIISKDFTAKYSPFVLDTSERKKWILDNYSDHINLAKSNTTKYWIYAPGENAERWDEFYGQGIMAIGYDKLGDLSKLKDKRHIKEALVNEYGFDKDPKNHALANLDIRDNINIGDIVISKRGTSKYLGYGIVDSNYFFDKEADSFKSRRKIKWKKRGEWDSEGFHIAQKTLTDITFDNDLVENIKRIIGIDNKDHMEMNIKNEVEEYKSINKIFFGPPGTGKTFRINQIANEKNYFSDSSSEVEDIINKRQKAFKFEMLGLPKGTVLTFSKDETITCEIIDNERVLFRGEPTSLSASALTIRNEMGYKTKSTAGPRNWCYNGKKLSHLRRELQSTDTTGNKIKQKNFTFVTFHQSFSYEDFIEGIKPVMDADDLKYEIRPGVFKEICEKARKDKNNKYAIFIDEINRGNVSSIFGELITLIEPDKRETMSMILPYSQEQFSVPKNLDIYGTMNTADRSVEALDTALRRRFVFEELPPNQDLVTKKIDGLEIDIKKLFNTINKRIEKLIDKDHMIGHSYFMNLKTPNDLKSTFQNKVIPLLQEYFFGDFGKIGLVLGEGFVEKDPESESSVFATFSDYDDSLLSEKEIYILNDVTKLDDDQFEDILKKLF